MNSFACFVLLVSVSVVSSVALPELHTIKRAFFSYPYSCQPGSLTFNGTALFLTEYGVMRNMPDLLYNGACGGEAFFDVMLAGDDFGLLADLGDVPLENLTASNAFNYARISGRGNIFVDSITVVPEHTYVALLAKGEVRALFVFKVESYEPNGPATIAYAIKQYSVVTAAQEAPGFSWSEPNHY